MKYSLAIFDLDGTILDTLGDLTDSVNYVLRKFGYPERTDRNIRSFLGNGSKVLIKKSLPENTDDKTLETVHNEFSVYYRAHCTIKTAPYEGIIQVIDELRKAGVKTAVISNKPDYGVQILCKEHFDGMFDYVSGERAGIPRKPDPESVNTVIKDLNSSKEKTVYIGDSEVDILTAKNAGTDCIAVTWGFRDFDVLKDRGTEMIANKPTDILKMIKEM